MADVLGMHIVLVQRHGGDPGLRDPGALEAALFRPQTGYYNDMVAEAAALICARRQLRLVPRLRCTEAFVVEA